jgi:hypothetical protein
LHDGEARHAVGWRRGYAIRCYKAWHGDVGARQGWELAACHLLAVAGRCVACRRQSLLLGDRIHVTCQTITCHSCLVGGGALKLVLVHHAAHADVRVRSQLQRLLWGKGEAHALAEPRVAYIVSQEQ